MSTNVFAARSARSVRRQMTNLVAHLLIALVAALVVGVLVWVVGYVAAEGFKFLGPEFLTQNPPGDPSAAGGGFFNGIVGSLIIVGLATLMAAPIGIGAAIYLVEFGRGRFAESVRFVANVLTGIPTIVTGALVYAVWVVHFGFSGFAGSLALAIVMVPLITKTTEEMLRLVPKELREGSSALGATPTQTTLRVVLPAAATGIATGLMLAIARAMGETAPLLLTALGDDLYTEANPGHRMSTLSLQIFNNAITGFRAAQARAWAGALTLIGLVLILTIASRLLTRRMRVRS